MTHSLRLAHRRISGILAVLLPAVCALGLLQRPTIAPALPSTPSANAMELWRRSDLFGPDWVVECTALRDPVQGPGLRLRLSDKNLAPDVLLYWVPEPQDPAGLGARAEFLGRLEEGTSIPIPSRPRSPGAGRLVLYSLGRSEILDRSLPLRWPSGADIPLP